MIIQDILKIIRDDYKNYNDQEWTTEQPTSNDLANIRNEAKHISDWDEDKLRLRLFEEASTNATTFTSGINRVICLRSNKSKSKPTPRWIRAIRILSERTPVKVLWFTSEQRRSPPPVGETIRPKHVNGGYTQRCNAQSIVIYREEEALRVLIHELLHAACSDPVGTDLAELEADTEAWAEIILVGLAAKGDQKIFDHLWKKHATFVMEQISAAGKYYNTRTKEEYGWRYIIGRVDVFKEHGLWMPSKYPEQPRIPKTLRLTAAAFDQ